MWHVVLPPKDLQVQLRAPNGEPLKIRDTTDGPVRERPAMGNMEFLRTYVLSDARFGMVVEHESKKYTAWETSRAGGRIEDAFLAAIDGDGVVDLEEKDKEILFIVMTVPPKSVADDKPLPLFGEMPAIIRQLRRFQWPIMAAVDSSSEGVTRPQGHESYQRKLQSVEG